MDNRIGKIGRKAMNANKKQNSELVDDITNSNLDDDIQIGRVIKTMGFGQCKVFYLHKGAPCIAVATIRGKFGRGGAKRAVPIRVGSIIALADTQLAGSSRYQIISMLGQDDLHAIRKHKKIDGRLLDITLVDETTIMGIRTIADDDGYEFDAEIDVECI